MVSSLSIILISAMFGTVFALNKIALTSQKHQFMIFLCLCLLFFYHQSEGIVGCNINCYKLNVKSSTAVCLDWHSCNMIMTPSGHEPDRSSSWDGLNSWEFSCVQTSHIVLYTLNNAIMWNSLHYATFQTLVWHIVAAWPYYIALISLVMYSYLLSGYMVILNT